MVRTQILLDSTSELVRARFSRRPSSCVVDIYDHGGNQIVDAQDATLGVTTTVNADSGAGQTDRRVVYLSEVVSLEFLGHYVVINAALQQEPVQLISVPSNGACETSEPLAFAYAAGDTFESCEVSYTLSADETDETGRNFRARFTASMPGGAIEVKDVLFDVVKHRLEQPITARNLDERSPLIRNLLTANARGTNWATLLETAFGELYQDLVTQGLDPEKYIDSERLAQLHLYKLKVLLAEDGLKVGDEEYPLQTAKYFTKIYDRKLAEVCGKASWYDRSNDLVPTDTEDNPVARGRVL